MNNTLQTILVIITVGLAVWFLVRKFVWKPKKSNSDSCSKDDCGCH
jgi:chromate transport protein ChrA